MHGFREAVQEKTKNFSRFGYAIAIAAVVGLREEAMKSAYGIIRLGFVERKTQNGMPLSHDELGHLPQ